MQIPARILRAEADELFGPPERNTRQCERHQRILTFAQATLAKHGRHKITIADLSKALRIAPITFHHHFCDIEALLGHILQTHLLAVAAAIGEIPNNDPDRDRKRRAAYLAATRHPFGGFSDPHLLLVRDRHTLPDDILPHIEATRAVIGDLLAGEMAEEALALLDTPSLDASRIEARLQPTPPKIQPGPVQPAIRELPTPAPIPKLHAASPERRIKCPGDTPPSSLPSPRPGLGTDTRFAAYPIRSRNR